MIKLKKMIKLENIYSEIKSEIKLISLPAHKKQLMNEFLDGHFYVFYEIINSLNDGKNFQMFLQSNGHNNVLEFLNNFGYDEDNINIMNDLSKKIELVFKLFKPNELIIITLNNKQDEEIKLIKQYKTLHTYYIGDDEWAVLLY